MCDVYVAINCITLVVWLACNYFLEIAFVCTLMCVCLSTPKDINNQLHELI